MQIDAKIVKQLRDRTGAGFMDCKEALKANEGDMDKALEYLQKKGLERLKKRESRTALQGVIGHKVADNGQAATLVELNCETDFVARSDEFMGFAQNLASHILEKAPLTLSASQPEEKGEQILMDQPLSHQTSTTVGLALADLAGKIGEKIEIGRFIRLEVDEKPGIISPYIHTGAQIACLVELGVGNPSLLDKEELHTLGHDLALHIVAANPDYVTSDQVPPAAVEKQREIFLAQSAELNKPANIIEKIVNGKIAKWYEEICLLEQPFVRDPDVTVAALVAKTASGLSTTLTVRRFVRYAVGQRVE